MMLPSEVTEMVFAQNFRRLTKEFAAVFLTEFWLNETFFQLGVIQPTIVPEVNGVWRAAW